MVGCGGSQPATMCESSSFIGHYCSQRETTSTSSSITARHTKLKQLAARRLGGASSLSRLSSIVLTHYLSCCVQMSESARDIDAVIFDMDGVLCEQAPRVLSPSALGLGLGLGLSVGPALVTGRAQGARSHVQPARWHAQQGGLQRRGHGAGSDQARVAARASTIRRGAVVVAQLDGLTSAARTFSRRR